MTTTMSFGVQSVQQNVEWRELLEFWRFLEEETAVESLWTMDHLVASIQGRLPEVPCFEREHFQLTEVQLREEVPVGSASHVRDVVAQYAELGVSAIIFPAPGPWDREVFRYLDESVIRPLAPAVERAGR